MKVKITKNDLPTAFSVDGQWYEANYALVKYIENVIGKEWTNKKIIEYVKANPKEYKITEDEGKIFKIREIKQ